MNYIKELEKVAKGLKKMADAQPVRVVLCNSCLEAGYAVNLKKSAERGAQRFCNACQEWVDVYTVDLPKKTAKKFGLV